MSRRGGIFCKSMHSQKWLPHEKVSAARLDELLAAAGVDQSLNEKQREAARIAAEARRAERAAKQQDEKWPLVLERHRLETESATNHEKEKHK